MDSLANIGKPIEIMLVEDNPGDVFLTKKAFKTAKITNQLMVAEDGEIAMAMLRKEGKYKDTVTPDLILLDLNLPGKDGREVLEEIKEDEELRRIPVIILTSSHAEKDILESYNMHANSYVIKPLDFSKFTEIVKSIEDFWFTTVVLPTGE
ncbi:MAG: response regulator [Lentisphaeraceae bacterium]|nr:response regulator [Lentisphaeraceae bacterium]